MAQPGRGNRRRPDAGHARWQAGGLLEILWHRTRHEVQDRTGSGWQGWLLRRRQSLERRAGQTVTAPDESRRAGTFRIRVCQLNAGAVMTTNASSARATCWSVQAVALSLLCLVLCAMCFAAASARADDWPQWRGPNRDGVWRETGVLETIPASGLE